jgi:hypothetical protein
MKFLFWNVRGFGNPKYRVALKIFCTSHKPDINFIAEPMYVLILFRTGFGV